MSPLEIALKFLESQRLSVRRSFTIKRDGDAATIRRGAMQIYVTQLPDDQVQVVYEHAVHERARERLPAATAGPYLLALVQRDRLCRIDVSSV